MRILVPLRENEAVYVAASIKKPIHNVKEAGKSRMSRSIGPKALPRKSCLHLWSMVGAAAARPLGVFETGGAYRDRTDDPLLAKQVLSQLS